jgi:hypothetical protein
MSVGLATAALIWLSLDRPFSAAGLGMLMLCTAARVAWRKRARRDAT